MSDKKAKLDTKYEVGTSGFQIKIEGDAEAIADLDNAIKDMKSIIRRPKPKETVK